MVNGVTGAFLYDSNLCLYDSNLCFDTSNQKPSFTMEYRDKEYTLIPNCRNNSLINKSEAVKILEVNETKVADTKWTKLDDLTDKEKKEYEKDGFIIEKICKKEEENVDK